MKRLTIGLVLAGLAAGVTVDVLQAAGQLFFWHQRPKPANFLSTNPSFKRVATLGNYLNNGADAGEETVSEIIAATANGNTLVYTDAVRGTIGFINITNPSSPLPLGTLVLDPNLADDIEHSPTSVDVLGNQYALVAVDTTTGEFDTPSGYLRVVDVSNPAAPFFVGGPIDLGGQPDSVKISPDESFVAIAIENQRNEDLCVGGTDDGIEADEEDCIAGGGAVGVLPQAPAGFLVVIALTGPPAGWVRQDVNLQGLASYAPEDPEPEFVDINQNNEAVVTLQENNHIVIVDLPTLTVTDHFNAGAVTLTGIDATDDGVISLTESLSQVPREPDAVTWVWEPGGSRIATANEGDLFGGSRGFSIFRRNGSVAFDSRNELDELAVQHGHYPDGRSDAKGAEPESILYAQFALGGGYLFVGTERSSFIAVYTLDQSGTPTFRQLLPGPSGPEGLLAIPQRNLLIASGEEDAGDFGVRSSVMIYQLSEGTPTYPQILSDDSGRSPIPWSALSGLVAIPSQPALLGVWDGFYAVSNIFRIDVSEAPALITDALTITGGSGDYDPEGIAIAPDDTLWVASEGNASDSLPNRLLHLDASGNVLQEIGLPAEIIACRAATTGAAPRRTLGSGFEGVAVLPGDNGQYRLALAQQRGWNYTTAGCEALDDDGGGLNALGEPNWTRIWIYDPTAGTWDRVFWELAPKPANAAWVGLSEITFVPGGDLILIERDNRTGDFGELKTLVKVNGNAAADDLISQSEKATYDLLPNLLATSGWITDKPEGVAVTSDGRAYVVTDNDGVDDWSGETWFFDLGRFWDLFD
ncbi:MAG TPA: esterase-like activity of phytase family protein [Vicinamibacterales bacterium]